jgi:hypothetical protein
MKPFPSRRFPSRVHVLSAAVAAALLAVACGGGSGGYSGVNGTLNGTTAVGAPIVGATVKVSCAGGSALTSQETTATGAWQVTLAGQTLPCGVQVNDGTINGVANATPYHSVALALGTVNITPLTDLVVANVSGKQPSVWFTGLSNTSEFNLITQTTLATAVTRIKTALNLASLSAIDPLVAPFTAVSGNALDDALTALKNSGIAHASLLTEAAKGASFAAPAGFNDKLTLAFADTVTGGGTGDITPKSLSIEKIGGYVAGAGPAGAVGAAEITAYDEKSKRLFIVNGVNESLDVLDLTNPAAPVKRDTLNSTALGGVANSISIFDGVIAVAIEAKPKTSAGKVNFYNTSTLALLGSVNVGSQPDMLTFSPDGKYVVVANEGEPNSYNNAPIPPATTASVSIDPEGSVSVITVNRTTTNNTPAIAPTVASADFKSFIGQEATLRTQGVRIFGPNANAAQDLEPEYVTISSDSTTAYVTLQENNAIAIVDIATAKVSSVKPLGFKDHSVAGMGLDASDEDAGTNTNSGTPAVKIATYPVKGMYQPDGIASYTFNGQTYLVTANEGEARADWPGYTDETRVRAHCSAGLDPNVFTDANLTFDSNLGRLRITANPNGTATGKNSSGQCNELYSFGGRSFTIWSKDVVRVFDSGDQFEQATKALPNVLFNASHDNNTLDGRSASKGPEPEGVTVGKIGVKTFAFVGLERVGGVMVYDITDPSKASFVTYFNPRTDATGDRGPEGVHFISAAKSPNGKPLLILGNEQSGTVSVLQLNLSY